MGSKHVQSNSQEETQLDETHDISAFDSPNLRSDETQSPIAASAAASASNQAATDSETPSQQDDPEISKETFWKVIDLVVTERQHGDRTAAIAAWKAYSSEERQNALREMDEALRSKQAAKDAASAESALLPAPASNPTTAQSKKIIILTNAFGSSDTIHFPFIGIIRMIKRDKSCSSRKAYRLFKSYGREERLKLLEAYEAKLKGGPSWSGLTPSPTAEVAIEGSPSSALDPDTQISSSPSETIDLAEQATIADTASPPDDLSNPAETYSTAGTKEDTKAAEVPEPPSSNCFPFRDLVDLIQRDEHCSHRKAIHIWLAYDPRQRDRLLQHYKAMGWVPNGIDAKFFEPGQYRVKRVISGEADAKFSCQAIEEPSSLPTTHPPRSR